MKHTTNLNELRKRIGKNVRFALTGEEAPEDKLARAEKALAGLGPKEREALLRAQPEVVILESAVAVAADDNSKMNDNMMAAISGAGWLINLMGEVGIEDLSQLLEADVVRLDKNVERQAQRLRTAQIRSYAAHNADMLLKVAPNAFTGMLIDEKNKREELARAEELVKKAKGKPKAK